jgi:AcrR family transcriptional regulator
MSKKKSIIDAAAFLFAEKGFYAATVEEIASQAGIGKSTVYGYFPSKDHIFQEMLKYSFKIYMESMKGRLKPPYSLRDVLTDVATAHFKFNNLSIFQRWCYYITSAGKYAQYGFTVNKIF